MKRNTLLIVVTMSVPIFSAWAQTKPAYLDYLKDTANEIYELEKGSLQLKPGDLERISASACKTLERLLADDDFKKDLTAFDKKRSKDIALQNQIRHDLNSFINSFANPESGLLRKAGLSDEATTDILFSAAFFHDAPSAPDSAAILAGTDRLRRDICSAAEGIKKQQDQVKSASDQLKRFRKWELGIGGLTLIVVDVAAAAETAALSTASAAVGGQMFGEAIKE